MRRNRRANHALPVLRSPALSGTEGGQRRRIAVAVLGGLLILGSCWAYFSCPLIVLTSDALLWESEYDASRQGTYFPGPGIPCGEMKAGDRLRVLWSVGGKDYRAHFVVAPHQQS